MCFLFVCWLCFDKHGSCEDTLTSRAARRFPVVRLVCTLAEEFFVGLPLFCGILSVLRIRVRHRDMSFLFLCLTERVLLRGTFVRGLASLDERNIGRRFLLRPTEQISAEWERLYVDSSLSCNGTRRTCSDDAICCWETRKRAIGVVVALCSNVSSSVVGVKFCFVSVFVSSKLCCGPQCIHINGCGLARLIVVGL